MSVCSYITIVYVSLGANLFASRPNLNMDLADKSVAGTRDVHPFGDIEIGSTSDTFDVDVAGGVVVASLVAAVVDGDLMRAILGVRDGVRKRHTRTESLSQHGARSIQCKDLISRLTIQGRR